MIGFGPLILVLFCVLGSRHEVLEKIAQYWQFDSSDSPVEPPVRRLDSKFPAGAWWDVPYHHSARPVCELTTLHCQSQDGWLKVPTEDENSCLRVIPESVSRFDADQRCSSMGDSKL